MGAIASESGAEGKRRVVARCRQSDEDEIGGNRRIGVHDRSYRGQVPRGRWRDRRADALRRLRYTPCSNPRVRSCEGEGRSKKGVSSDPCGWRKAPAAKPRVARMRVLLGKASGLWPARAGICTRIEIYCLGIAQKAIVKGSQGL